MPIREAIQTIREQLTRGIFQNEAQVSQGIVRRVLSELGWDTFDPEVVVPEFAVGGGRVDFALCYPRCRPFVFVEVKQLSTIEGGDRQLFRYAFEQGVPIAVLTNGREWHFYLPSGQGAIDDRRFYLLDLLSRDLDESVARLQRYLAYEAARTGSARRDADDDYRSRARETETAAALPRALSTLMREGDDLLVDLLLEKVAELTGYQPARDVAVNFLATCADRVGGLPALPTVVPPPTPVPPEPLRPEPHLAPRRELGYEFEGRWYPCRSGREVMIEVLRLLARRDPNFLTRFTAIRHGRRRRWVARTKAELYPGREDLQEDHAEELTPGWWVGTNYSAVADMPRIITAACQVAGIRFGSELKATFQ